MKKVLFGFLIGAILAFNLSVYAGGFIGKTVDATYPLFVDNVRCTVDAISIEGTSYIPVRAAADLFGYDVNFASDVILLTKQQVIQQPVSTIIDIPITTPVPPTPPKTETITMAEYNQLEVGMSYEEAVRIIGGPGKISNKNEHSIIYTWYGTPGHFTGADIRFINGKLDEKLQQGLE